MPVFKSVNKDFFKKWSRDMAYVLGFFAADGYITVNKRGGQFWCIDIGDKELLEKIKKAISSEHKISIRNRVGGKYVTYRLQIGSNEMCDDLRVLGFDERKTRRMSLPKIPSKYVFSFARGYFDGDGNVWTGLIHKERKTKTLVIQTVFTSCSLDFLKNLRSLLELFGIMQGRIRIGKGNYYRLVYSITNSLNLYDFMYNSLDTSHFFLKRKKDVFDEFIRMRP